MTAVVDLAAMASRHALLNLLWRTGLGVNMLRETDAWYVGQRLTHEWTQVGCEYVRETDGAWDGV
eukprot:3832654-Prymnesium_polylepis.1